MKKSESRKSKTSGSQKTPSQLIDARIDELGDWRGKMLSRLRTLIREADPEVVEEWKWRGVPVWSHDGLICTGETYKSVVKMTFAKGAALKDPSGLFNASLDGNAKACDRFPRGRPDRREGVEDPHSRRGDAEQVESSKLIHGVQIFSLRRGPLFELPVFCALHKAQARCGLNDQPRFLVLLPDRFNQL